MSLVRNFHLKFGGNCCLFHDESLKNSLKLHKINLNSSNHKQDWTRTIYEYNQIRFLNHVPCLCLWITEPILQSTKQIRMQKLYDKFLLYNCQSSLPYFENFFLDLEQTIFSELENKMTKVQKKNIKETNSTNMYLNFLNKHTFVVQFTNDSWQKKNV